MIFNTVSLKSLHKSKKAITFYAKNRNVTKKELKRKAVSLSGSKGIKTENSVTKTNYIDSTLTRY